MPIANALGLIQDDVLKDVQDRRQRIAAEISRVKGVIVKPDSKTNFYLAQKGSPELQTGIPLDRLLKRAGMKYDVVDRLAPASVPIEKKVARQVEIEIKYEGYIERQLREIEKFRHLERIKIPDAFDYQGVHGLSNELKEKLTAVRPSSLGQASRVDGITPAAISVLMVAVKSMEKSPSPKEEHFKSE
jgi:tRNA uridine 5-carboxymethylaminomethyl modification enzyme